MKVFIKSILRRISLCLKHNNVGETYFLLDVYRKGRFINVESIGDLWLWILVTAYNYFVDIKWLRTIKSLSVGLDELIMGHAQADI